MFQKTRLIVVDNEVDDFARQERALGQIHDETQTERSGRAMR